MADRRPSPSAAGCPPPLSVLDLAPTEESVSGRDAQAATVATARRAGGLGLRRVWVAEHHGYRSVGRRWVQRLRLEACRRDLVRPEPAGRTAAAIAHRWGFAATRTSARTFRAVQGLSPAEGRQAGALRAAPLQAAGLLPRQPDS